MSAGHFSFLLLLASLCLTSVIGSSLPVATFLSRPGSSEKFTVLTSSPYTPVSLIISFQSSPLATAAASRPRSLRRRYTCTAMYAAMLRYPASMSLLISTHVCDHQSQVQSVARSSTKSASPRRAMFAKATNAFSSRRALSSTYLVYSVWRLSSIELHASDRVSFEPKMVTRWNSAWISVDTFLLRSSNDCWSNPRGACRAASSIFLV
mmetsp:Transcript_20633/g.59776  ORF Transcript_20633/g.59776 Transcript_20633/m.59776 type:complete len:208 (+) Transcript_20633:129-752(+)